MTFIVIFIALLLERFFDWSHLRKWQWYQAYSLTIINQFPSQPPYLLLADILVPLLLAVLLLSWIFSGWLFGVVKFLWMLFILIYCLGPQNLWADTFACINALTHNSAQFAYDKLKMTFGVKEDNSSQVVHKHFFNQIFIEANRRIFAVVFWFLILGPFGAVLYRAISLSAHSQTLSGSAPKVVLCAEKCESVLDWIPVRIFTFVLGLGGHFAKVYPIFRKKALLGSECNDILLSECGAASISNGDGLEMAIDGTAEKNAIHLLDRTFIITLVMILLLSLIV
jgi:membrane protein required for beta-lactamase induction